MAKQKHKTPSQHVKKKTTERNPDIYRAVTRLSPRVEVEVQPKKADLALANVRHMLMEQRGAITDYAMHVQPNYRIGYVRSTDAFKNITFNKPTHFCGFVEITGNDQKSHCISSLLQH